jgi:hypothetical protein
MQQLKVSDYAQFITLTYNADHVPYTNSGRMALNKVDLQKFFKRLRKAHGTKGKPIRYYAVGEYGTGYQRPHYHIILFNCKAELIQNAWKDPGTGKHIGSVHYGDQRGVNGASIGYTLMYIEKPTHIGRCKTDDRPREFALMSKGLGKNYLTPQMISWHHADMANRMYINVGDGKKAAMPRYYKQKLYNELQREKNAQSALEKLLLAEFKKYERLDAKQAALERWNNQQAIAAAFKKMYAAECRKTKI